MKNGSKAKTNNRRNRSCLEGKDLYIEFWCSTGYNTGATSGLSVILIKQEKKPTQNIQLKTL